MYSNKYDLSLLYVEDEQGILEQLSDIFRNIFKEVYIAKDGQEGLEVFKNSQIDLIITDINMPKINGIEMMKEIKHINKNTPFLITTAYSDKEFFLKAIELGANDYIMKPIILDELLEKIDKLSQSHKEMKIIDFISSQIPEISKLSSKDFFKKVEIIVNDKSSKLVNIGDFSYNFNTKRVLSKDSSIRLTNQEIIVLETLIKYRGEIVVYEILENCLLDVYNEVSISNIRNIVKSIRNKTCKNFIKTLPKSGYKVEWKI